MQIAEGLARNLERLGLERRAKPVPDLASYLKAREERAASPPPSREGAGPTRRGQPRSGSMCDGSGGGGAVPPLAPPCRGPVNPARKRTALRSVVAAKPRAREAKLRHGIGAAESAAARRAAGWIARGAERQAWDARAVPAHRGLVGAIVVSNLDWD